MKTQIFQQNPYERANLPKKLFSPSTLNILHTNVKPFFKQIMLFLNENWPMNILLASHEFQGEPNLLGSKNIFQNLKPKSSELKM